MNSQHTIRTSATATVFLLAGAVDWATGNRYAPLLIGLVALAYAVNSVAEAIDNAADRRQADDEPAT